MPVAALLLFAASFAGEHVDLSRAEERRAAVSARCHIATERLTPEPGDHESFTLLRITGDAALSDAQLLCYGDVLAEVTQVWPSIEDGGLYERYDALITAGRLRDARADLRRRGLLAALPRFDRRNETLEAFAARLEALCGALPHSVLIVEEGTVRLSDVAFRESHGDPQIDRDECTREAATAAGFDPLTIHAIVSIPSDLSLPNG